MADSRDAARFLARFEILKGQRSKSSFSLRRALSREVMMNPKDRHPAPHPQGAFSGTAGKEVNTASLCRIGQETVQEIVSKTQEVFGLLKTWQLPNGVNPNIHQERQTKLQDLVRQMEKVKQKNQQLKVLMDQLRELIWDVNAMMVANSARSAVR
uniref:Mediator of RNA polymerase II transcription subunit 30 n=1 Tax=Branchiostoma floridae TaxID=7739 RepID=C3ZTY0_BRAFL|eukprot:XP_002588011.1 hypothetical protein BRAFLDRAFT_88995 [Branchiostoma floridae]